jgi:hypothetical protein
VGRRRIRIKPRMKRLVATGKKTAVLWVKSAAVVNTM